MKAADALAAAREWVVSDASGMENYCGAYLSGSVLEREPGAEWPVDSDVDVVVLFDGALPEKIGKFRRNGVLLEITALPKSALTDETQVLSTHYLAFAMNGGGVLDDPQGFLLPLARRVQAAFFEEEWLMARVRTTADIARRHIGGMTQAQTPEARLMSCCFGPSAIALPILAAAGRNCTVRKRLPRAREVLQAYGMPEVSVRLEEALGCAELTAAQLIVHMDALERTFCRAMATEGPSADYAFRSDIRPDAKPVAVDGTRAMILGEHPSDGVFWLAATFARCMTVLHMDDAQAYAECLPAMQALADTLGIGDADAVRKRQALARQILAEAEEAAARIAAETAKMSANGMREKQQYKG